MEPILAKQSVDIKCRIQASVMMGNYEFYYAAGRLCAQTGQQPDQPLQPLELSTFLQPLLHRYDPKEESDAYLVKMLKEYEASDEYDEQMDTLFEMGLAAQ